MKMALKKIILDTNFLLIPSQFNIDIFKEIERIADFNYELLVFDKSVDELKNIGEKQKGKASKQALTALKLLNNSINNKKINIIPAKTGYIDREITDFAEKDQKIIVATQDIGLIKKLKKIGIKIITMRQKKYLIIE